MQIEEIASMWEKDCVIDRTNIAEESLRTPLLHQKYLGLLLSVRNKLIKLNYDYLEMKNLRARYYLGELTKEELKQYNWEQYQGLKPLKSDLNFKLESDPELLKIKVKIEYLENIAFQLESILNQIKNRDWQIRNYIQWQMFQSGN